LTGIINHPSLGQHRLTEANERIGPMLNRLVERSPAGSLREGLVGTDIVFLQLAMDATRDVTPELYRRYLAIFLDGIRAEAAGPDPLPLPAPTAEQTPAGPLTQPVAPPVRRHAADLTSALTEDRPGREAPAARVQLPPPRPDRRLL
jgi:hypothetical protein